MVFVFTCTVMIHMHGDLGPDKFKKVLRCYTVQVLQIRTITVITKLRW